VYVADTQTRAAQANAQFLAELDARLEQLGRRLDQLVETLAAAQAAPGAPGGDAAPVAEGVAPAGHILFLPTPAGYELVERPGPPPAPGETVEIEGRLGAYVAAKVGPAPLPGDRRPCVYLQLT